MDFSTFFAAFQHEDSIVLLVFMLLSFLIGFVLAWIMWGGRARRAEQEVARLRNELEQLQGKVADLTEQLELKDADLARAMREADEARTQLEALGLEKGELEAENLILRQKLEKQQATIRSLEQTLEDLNDQIVGLKTKNRQLTEQIEREEVASNLLAEMQSSHQALINRLAELETRFRELDEKNRELSERLVQMLGSAQPLGAAVEPTPIAEPVVADMPPEVAQARQHVIEAVREKLPKVEEGQQDDLTLIRGIGPFIERKLNELGIFTYEQVAALDDELIEQLTVAIEFFPGRIKRDDWVGQARRLATIKKENPGALSAEALFPDNPEDLTIIEGIGPKIAELLKENGIRTWEDLAAAPVERLRHILEEAGGIFKQHDPATWPMQAQLAVKRDWSKLKEYQDYLVGGKEPTA